MDEAAARFIADVRKIAGDYDEAASKHDEQLQAVREECEARTREAYSRHRAAAIEQNAQYQARITQAARIRADQANDEQTADDIRQAAAHINALVGGACHDQFTITPDIVRSELEHEAAERERIRKQEEEESKQGASAVLVLW